MDEDLRKNVGKLCEYREQQFHIFELSRSFEYSPSYGTDPLRLVKVHQQYRLRHVTSEDSLFTPEYGLVDVGEVSIVQGR